MDFVENFEKWKKKSKDFQETKKRDRWLGKIDRKTWHNDTAFTCPPSSESYREGWDRIFGKKKPDEESSGSEENSLGMPQE